MTAPRRKKRRGFPLLRPQPSLRRIDAGLRGQIVISGVLFFTFRNTQYAHATLFITLLVLLCFNLLAVNFIWQDWKFRQLSQVINRTMNTNCRYLDAILVQYYQGKDNGLSYRIAHRDAHNSDAELASVISNMSAEPKSDQTVQEKAFRLLCLNHTMLSYISALEAHRDKLDNLKSF